MHFEFNLKTKIIAGDDSYEKIPSILEKLNTKTPIIITDEGIKKANILKKLISAMESSYINEIVIYDRVPPDSSFDTVSEIKEIYKKNRCNSIIALGGGSVIDTAKGVNILVSLDIDSLSDVEGSETINEPLKPLIVIPTTTGTGSEVTSVAVIRDNKNNTKKAFADEFLLPDYAILDPRSVVSLPERLIASTTIDSLSHAIESHISIQKNPISQTLSKTAVKLIFENLPSAIEKRDKKALFNLLLASTLSGLAFSNSMVGIVHAIGHAIGALKHIHHGHLMGIILPEGLRFNTEYSESEYSELLYFIDLQYKGDRKERALRFIEKVENSIKKVFEFTGLENKLSQLGVSEEDFPEIVEKAINDGSINFNPKPVKREDLLKILRKIL